MFKIFNMMRRKIKLDCQLAIIKSFELWKCLLHVGWTVVKGDVHSDCGEEEGLRGFIWPDNVTTANQTNANQTSGTQTYEVLPLPKGDDDLVYKAQLMSISFYSSNYTHDTWKIFRFVFRDIPRLLIDNINKWYPRLIQGLL